MQQVQVRTNCREINKSAITEQNLSSVYLHRDHLWLYIYVALPASGGCRWGWGYARKSWQKLCRIPAPWAEPLSWLHAGHSKSAPAHWHMHEQAWSLSKKHHQTHHPYLQEITNWQKTKENTNVTLSLILTTLVVGMKLNVKACKNAFYFYHAVSIKSLGLKSKTDFLWV